MIIMDSFALPVEGTETRVNAQAAAYEYMAAYIENAKQVRHRHSDMSGLRKWEASDHILIYSASLFIRVMGVDRLESTTIVMNAEESRNF